VPTTKSTPFNMNGTQRRTLVIHEDCIVCIVAWQKAPLELKRRQTVKKSSLIALAIVELHECEGISQAVS